MTRQKHNWSIIFDAITLVAVVVGVTLGAIELRQLRNEQESQGLILLYQALQDPDIVRGRDIIRTIPDTISVAGVDAILAGPDGPLVQRVLLTYEGMGAMVYRGDIPIEWVDELFRFGITDTWKKLKPAVVARRERTSYPGVLEWVQWLSEQLEKRATQRSAKPAYELYRDWEPPN